jgi:hypothetical protein
MRGEREGGREGERGVYVVIKTGKQAKRRA